MTAKDDAIKAGLEYYRRVRDGLRARGRSLEDAERAAKHATMERLTNARRRALSMSRDADDQVEEMCAEPLRNERASG